MRIVAVTQRVDVAQPAVGPAERRDGLDQAWFRFLAAAGCLPVPLPNHLSLARRMLEELAIDGLLLTGGDSLALYGGETPERDEVETALLALARRWRLPVIGVCRGMQLIQHAFGAPLQPVEGHVGADQIIEIEGAPARVNSFHRWGALREPDGFDVWARATGGVVKAVRHRTEPLVGLMWHPERLDPFRPEDLALFRILFARRDGPDV
jgi:putative glutamine amidotransferase